MGFGQGRPIPKLQPGVSTDIEVVAVQINVAQGRGDHKEKAEGEYAAKKKSMAEMRAIGHAAVLEKTPVREGGTPLGLDAHFPAWLARS